MQEEIFRRRRTPAIIDKKRTTLNYDKLDNNNESKQNFINRLSKIGGLSNNEIENMKKQAIVELEAENKRNNEEFLPTPPTKINNSNKIISEMPQFHSKSNLINNFDDKDVIDGKFSLIDLNGYISKFNEQEIKHLNFTEVFSFDPNEYDKAYDKIDKMKKTAKNIKDETLTEFFRSKKRAIELEKEKIKVVHNHFDKIQDMILFDDSMKFFFNKDSLNK